jgi:hypothetical protein
MDWTIDNAATRGFAAGEGAGSIGVPPVTTGQEGPSFAPFAVLTDGTVTLMYVPSGCVTVNGKAFSPTGLTEDATLTGWYVVTSFTSGLKLYVDFSDEDGLSGKPIAASFAASTPYSGLYLEIPILSYGDGRFTSICKGALHLERTGLDSQGSASTRKSLAKPGGTGWTDEDHTMELHGFKNASAPDADPFDTEDSVTHHFPVREVSSGGTAELRWMTAANLAKGVADYVSDPDNDAPVTPDYETFWDWYDALTDEEKRFWEKGADYSVNYGSSIGDSSEEEAINLDDKLLKDSWIIEQDLLVKVVNCKEVNITTETGVPGYSGNLTVAGTFNYQGKNIHLGSGGLVYWSD